MDLYENLKLVIDFAIDREVDFLLFGGDAYETSKPLEEYRHMFRREIVRAAQTGITCILIPGNHDMTKRETAEHALAEFRDIPGNNIYLIDQPTLLEFDQMWLYALPWQYGEFDEPIIDMPDKLRVCMAHCTVLGATFDSGQVIHSLDKDFGVNLSFFEQFDLVLLGHIHAPQVLLEDPFVGYPGSSEWLTWGELGALHGWFYFDGATVQHLPYNHRKRYNFDWQHLDVFNNMPVVDLDAMYRITVRDVHAEIIRQHFKECFELKIVPVTTRLHRPELTRIKDTMTKREMLVEYMDQDWDDDMAKLFDEIEGDVLAQN